MASKRLIFTLLYDSGFFYHSRNFRLQRVGDINWLIDNYDFEYVSKYIDELIILDVCRTVSDKDRFLHDVTRLISKCFIPVALGGGVRTLEDVDLLIQNGADKVVINSLFYLNPSIIQKMASVFGSQSIVAWLDYKIDAGRINLYHSCGTQQLDDKFECVIRNILDLSIGELVLNSMKRDGTGQGFDLDILMSVPNNLSVPLILSGGAGNASHFLECLKTGGIDAVTTANLFNFIGDALPDSRKFLLANDIDLAKWH